MALTAVAQARCRHGGHVTSSGFVLTCDEAAEIRGDAVRVASGVNLKDGEDHGCRAAGASCQASNWSCADVRCWRQVESVCSAEERCPSHHNTVSCFEQAVAPQIYFVAWFTLVYIKSQASSVT
jgi:hypothetical protein